MCSSAEYSPALHTGWYSKRMCAREPRGHDYVLIARRAAISYPFERLAADLSAALRRRGKSAKAARGKGAGDQPAGTEV